MLTEGQMTLQGSRVGWPILWGEVGEETKSGIEKGLVLKVGGIRVGAGGEGGSGVW